MSSQPYSRAGTAKWLGSVSVKECACRRYAIGDYCRLPKGRHFFLPYYTSHFDIPAACLYGWLLLSRPYWGFKLRFISRLPNLNLMKREFSGNIQVLFSNHSEQRTSKSLWLLFAVGIIWQKSDKLKGMLAIMVLKWQKKRGGYGFSVNKCRFSEKISVFLSLILWTGMLLSGKRLLFPAKRIIGAH